MRSQELRDLTIGQSVNDIDRTAEVAKKWDISEQQVNRRVEPCNGQRNPASLTCAMDRYELGVN
jgi:hypothetical protein